MKTSVPFPLLLSVAHSRPRSEATVDSQAAAQTAATGSEHHPHLLHRPRKPKPHPPRSVPRPLSSLPRLIFGPSKRVHFAESDYSYRESPRARAHALRLTRAPCASRVIRCFRLLADTTVAPEWCTKPFLFALPESIVNNCWVQEGPANISAQQEVSGCEQGELSMGMRCATARAGSYGAALHPEARNSLAYVSETRCVVPASVNPIATRLIDR